jgi:CO/xanthine dehydrogenase Mo-binding subunit
MNTITADQGIANNDAARGQLFSTDDVDFAQLEGVKDLNVEIVVSNPLLSTDRMWAIRFKADGTVMIVLGMRDYGRGWYSGYFASLVAARLGVPFRRLRIYYSATLPAVLQTPVRPPTAFRRSQTGPVASAVADIIDAMCDQVVEKASFGFAAMAGVEAVDVGFDQATGRFFVLGKDRSGNVLQIAEAIRGGEATKEAFNELHVPQLGRLPGTLLIIP